MNIPQADFLRITEGLNTKQRESVCASESTVLVVAGAGVGKTTVATRRISLFIASGIEPNKILALTFGNKAAKETKERVSSFIPEGKLINSYTYHSFALREVIQPYFKSEYFKSLGFTGYINIIDEKDSATFLREARDSIPGLKEVLKILEVKPKRIDSLLTYHRAFGKRADDFLNEVVNTEVTLQAGKKAPLSSVISFVDKIVKHLDGNKNPRADALESLTNFCKNNPIVIDYLIGQLWKSYEQICLSNNGIDFDDVLILSSRLIGSSSDVRKELATKFSHFVLDEFQDTNKVQYEMLQQIFDAFNEFGLGQLNRFYVGDTRQAIFRFRGADAKYMTDLKSKVSDIKICSLTENYRSSEEILSAANVHAKTMSGHLTDGALTSGTLKSSTKPDFIKFETAEEEADYIAQDIKSKIDIGVNPKDISVLYRTSAVKSDVERALAKYKIPYAVIGDASFYDAKEISDTISFLRMIVRPSDHLATSRVVDCFKGVTGFWYRNAVGQTSLTNIQFFEKQAHLFTAKSKPFQILYEGLLPILKNRHSFSIRETCLKLLHASIDKIKESGQSVSMYTPEFINTELIEGYEMYKNEPAFQNHRDKIASQYDAVKALWFQIYTPHLEKYVKDSGSDNCDELLQKRLSNINKLFDDVLERVLYDIDATIDSVVEDLIMASDVNLDADQSVQVLTIHKSKGLEYSNVYLPGLEQSIFFKDDDIDDDRLQDESQIFYVALTRAKEKLFCSASSIRTVNGETHASIEPLMFLTSDVLEKMNFTDLSVKQESNVSSGSAAWENLSTTELDETTASLLAGLRL